MQPLWQKTPWFYPTKEDAAGKPVEYFNVAKNVAGTVLIAFDKPQV